MTHSLLQLFAGIGLLIWGANRFNAGALGMAHHFKWSKLVAGVVIIGFGTSFPEMIVSAIAALKHKPAIAIGNAIGSNIANIGFVIAMILLMGRILVHPRILRREFFLIVAVTVLTGALMWNHFLSRLDGAILALAFVIYLIWQFRPMDNKAMDVVQRSSLSLSDSLIWWLFGLALLFISSETLINSATNIARHFGLSELMIGLTVVALGTSLPELATTLENIYRKENDVALSSVLGSNVFNLLIVLLMPAWLSPGPVSSQVIYQALPISLVFLIVLWLLTWLPPHRNHLGRPSGIILGVMYIAYLYWQLVS